AVLPLAVARRRGLRFMHAAGHEAFYCCDMLCENDEQAMSLWKAAYHSPHYDLADIRDVYSESASYKPLSSFANKRDVTEAYSLNIRWQSGDEWLRLMPGRTRREHFYHKRRLERKGAVRLEVCRSEPVPTEIIDRMIDQKIAWCKENKKPGLFDHPNVHEYFRQLTKKA